MSRSTLSKLTRLGIAASVLGVIADLLLLYVPGTQYERDAYLFLTRITRERSIAGALLGLLSIPLEVIAFRQLAESLGQNRDPLGRRWLDWSLTYLLVIGTGYHLLVPILRELVQFHGLTSSLHQGYLRVLEAGVLVTFLSMSGAWARLVSRGEFGLPVSFQWSSPLLFYGAILALYRLSPTVFGGIAVAGFNLSFLLFFGFLHRALYAKS